MLNRPDIQKYKKINLNTVKIEEYEGNYDNIGELLIKIGNDDISKECKVILKLSKEGLVGFGSYLVRLSNNFDEYFHVHIEPLGQTYSNQGMGFFLTPKSSEFIIGCRNFESLTKINIKNINKVNRNLNNFKVSYLVDLNFDNDYFECHNLGFNNIGELKVFNENEDISKKCSITLMLSKNGLLGFGTSLLRLAHNYDENNNYFINPVNSDKLDYELGFFLTKKSSPLVVNCKNLKNVFYYDSEFGTK